MNIHAADIKDVAEAPKLWQEIVDASKDGWLWHTWLAHEFNLCAEESHAEEDLSFFIYEDEKAVGVVPILIRRGSPENFKKKCEISWPCFRHNFEPEYMRALEDFAFEEIERRAKSAGADRILVLMIPSQNIGDEEVRVKRIAEAYAFEAIHFDSHVVIITDETLTTVRERYRRYHKKYASLFTLSIAEGAAVTPELEETYFQLHVKDAGGQFRSRESYTKQADIARGGEAFYVVAIHKESGIVAGMLLVSLYKNAAYDNSVAVDPDFSNRYVGHLLKWLAIEELQERHVPTYELGPKADERSSTRKELGITHFKEGWSRGHTRTIWKLEKVLES